MASEETTTTENNFDEAVTDDVGRIIPRVKDKLNGWSDSMGREWLIEDMSDREESAKLERVVENVQNIFYKILGRQWMDRHFLICVSLITRHVEGGNPSSAYTEAIKLRKEVFDAGYDNVVQLPSRRHYTKTDSKVRLEGDPQPQPVDKSYNNPSSD